MAFFHARINPLDIENSLSIFNCRVAGNVENFDILGSMEFARKLSGATVILVMGHTVLRLAGLLRRQSRVPGLVFPSKRGIYPAMEFETPCTCDTLRHATRAIAAAYDAALASSGLRITHSAFCASSLALAPCPSRDLPAEAALDRSTMGRNLDPLERRGLVRIEAGNIDQRERVAYLTAAGEAAIEAALPHWRKAQERIAALVQPSAIGELADQLDALGTREQNPA
jgi:DNA-binding MarR family transcriptional regulator